MSRIALYFASGESLYLGTALLLLALLASIYAKRAWMLRARNVVACVALVFMVMACPPWALVLELIFLAVFVLWLVTSNQALPSRVSLRIQRCSTLALAIFLLALSATEFSHRGMPRIASASDHLVVIGDSISSGISTHSEPWPVVFQQMCAMEVRNLARPGAQVSEGLLMAADLKESDHLVVIEIGGNDLLMGVSSDEYGKALDALLAKVAAPNRKILMFELPLLPNKIAYGQIQRRLSAKYGITLIPKRYLAQIIGDANGTIDGLHLSPSGAHRVATLVAEILSPGLKSCQSLPNLAAD
jgi:lysophospholipase L1-like esterase